MIVLLCCCLADVFGVGELSVESEAKDFGGVGGVDGCVVDGDVEIVVVLVSVGCVESGCGF